MVDSDVMNVEQLAEYLSVPDYTARRLLTSGKIRAAKVGKEWRVLKSEVDRYLRGEQEEEADEQRGDDAQGADDDEKA